MESRTKPRISVAKLGEDMEATAGRRGRILRDQKFPSEVKVNPYERARSSIRSVLLADGDVVARLSSVVGELERRSPKSPYDAESIQLSVSAIRQFCAQYTLLDFRGATAVSALTPQTHIVVEGVAISVTPSVALRRIGRSGREEWGALILAIRKGCSLDDRAGVAIGELLRLSLEANGYVTIAPSLCIVADVFSKRSFTATGRGQRVRQDVESACREISARWPTLLAAA